MKVECNRCSVPLTKDNWYPSHKKKNWHICKLCEKKRQRHWEDTNRNTVRNRNLKRNYGITETEYDEMFVKQKGVCAICFCPCVRANLSVDHDHKTGKVRGLLCIKCNAGLGHFNDDINLLEKAKEYLWR